MLHTLENDRWQAGILPQTGASLAFGRVRGADGWQDIFRPTPEADYGSSSACASFIMLPWCNRIKDGFLRLDAACRYPLRAAKDDGTARHGDVRNRAWHVQSAAADHIHMTFESSWVSDANWPWPYGAEASYRLEGAAFIWELALHNRGDQPFPAGFGHHPYFVKPTGAAAPEVEIACQDYFTLVDFVAVRAPEPAPPHLDFRAMRPLGDAEYNDLLTTRDLAQPAARLRWPAWGIELTMSADPRFEHVLLFAPAGKPFFAVEPMTNASDGFSLHAAGVPGHGVFVVAPGAAVRASVTFAAL